MTCFASRPLTYGHAVYSNLGCLVAVATGLLAGTVGMSSLVGTRHFVLAFASAFQNCGRLAGPLSEEPKS
jgi:hypothetical protein